jgi:hypothetical protein
MALRLLESWDHYQSAQFLQKWSAAPWNLPALAQASARTGLYGVHLDGNPNYVGLQYLPFDNTLHWILGCALKLTSGITGQFMFRFANAVNNAIQVSVGVGADNNIRIYAGDYNATVLTTIATGVTVGNWFYFEVDTLIDPAVGYCKVSVNGAQIGAVTGADTMNHGTGTGCAGFDFLIHTWNGSRTLVAEMDDFYACDGAGTVNHAPLGVTHVECLFPTSDVTTQLTPSNILESHAGLVNEQSQPNGDASYVYTKTPGQYDLYAIPQVYAPGATIAGVVVRAALRKDDAGLRTAGILLRSGTVTGVSPEIYLANEPSYYYVGDTYELDPNTSAAWTVAGLAAAQVGVSAVQ